VVQGGDTAGPPAIVAYILSHQHVVDHSAELVAVQPERNRRVRQAAFHIKMAVMERDTAIGVGGPRKEGWL
jgi:hypothetical protein